MQAKLDEDRCWAMYYFLRDNVEWVEGIRGRNGFTRLAYPILSESEFPEVFLLLKEAAKKLGLKSFNPRGIYLNYYANGEMYTPAHTHPDTKQLVISLGAARTFTLGSKKFSVENGDVFYFGSQKHGVPKDSSIEGRISIACFLD